MVAVSRIGERNWFTGSLFTWILRGGCSPVLLLAENPDTGGMESPLELPPDGGGRCGECSRSTFQIPVLPGSLGNDGDLLCPQESSFLDMSAVW